RDRARRDCRSGGVLHGDRRPSRQPARGRGARNADRVGQRRLRHRERDRRHRRRRRLDPRDAAGAARRRGQGRRMPAGCERQASLYLHLPYCQAKCPYCDFNAYAAAVWPEDAYAEALLAELRAYAASPPWSETTLATIFFGGGTPSLFQPATIARL